MALTLRVLLPVVLEVAALALKRSALPFGPSPTLVVFSSHHKTGTDLLEELVTTQESVKVFGKPMDLTWEQPTGMRGCLGCMGYVQAQPEFRKRGHDFRATRSRMYRNIDLASYVHLRESKRPYKMIHLIRDPMGVIVSGYFHHLKYSDTPRMMFMTGPDQLMKHSFLEGLQVEAFAELKGTIQEMLEVTNATQGDPNVLTIGVEDFKDNFNKTVQCMYSFLKEPGSLAVQKLVEAAQVANLKNRPAWELQKIDPGHFTDDELKDGANSLIAIDPHPVWKSVQKTRWQLGYFPLPGKNGMRHPQPFCDRFH
mmetsp:Transcript_73761/g.171065  ORF Transcript_73761/g.171065 Transcript_73761/m.171065 type:complete len:311 (-) Transcript_73761:81-1013(-)